MPEFEWIECWQCSGTGRDPDEADGRCIYCDGAGERESDYDPCEDLDCEDA